MLNTKMKKILAVALSSVVVVGAVASVQLFGGNRLQPPSATEVPLNTKEVLSAVDGEEDGEVNPELDQDEELLAEQEEKEQRRREEQERKEEEEERKREEQERKEEEAERKREEQERKEEEAERKREEEEERAAEAERKREEEEQKAAEEASKAEEEIIVEAPELPEIATEEPQPEETQPEETPEPAVERSVTITSSLDEDIREGDMIELEAVLVGFDDDDISLQWQYNDGTGWQDAENATDTSYEVEASVETVRYDWRIKVTVHE